MTLKTVIDDAITELSLPPLASVVENSVDPQARLLRRLLTAEGRMLAKRHAWQAITKEFAFATVAADAQPLSLPSDFDRYVPETMWDRTQKRFVYGPIDAQEWASISSSFVTMVNPGFRIRGNMILLTPVPAVGQTYAYEYVSNGWCRSGAGVLQTAMLADDDLALLDEEALTLGVIYRFRADKGFEFGDDLKEYERRVADLILVDGSRPRLQGSTIATDRVPRPPQAPETIVWP